MSKTILVTGADGFIGSHLTEYLLNKGYKVKALSLYNSFNFWGWLEEIPENKNLEIVTGDVRDPDFCLQIQKDVDITFNLAALIAIPFSYTAPSSYIDTNINGCLNICQAARELGNVRVIQISTSEVYGTAQYVPIDEKHPKQPQSPYSASKIGADALAMSFYYSFNLPVTIARPFNTFGPRQSARAIIPSIITQIATGKKVLQLGDLSPTRDLNFVLDTCEGLYRISQSDETIGKEVNVSSNYEISMQGVVDLIKKIMKADDVEIVTDAQRIRPKNSEVRRLWGDNMLIKNLTGFTPKYSLEEGLKITTDWFSQPNNLGKYKADIYNV